MVSFLRTALSVRCIESCYYYLSVMEYLRCLDIVIYRNIYVTVILGHLVYEHQASF